ncbi:uncharacterized protein EV422DRAFT_421826 [Fimicolochytrium jonesii]|uniref:uncharacterized protein n=1 Tax=Fimicolochytrium jonesii TaxID=1396493 RepID=UPI0022FF3D59|nr:uncharacterized protein EV422DRAFT_421826 [Fimicolochytrium jonesii]KAI8822230.1 hypothetical protein EV422DRAFT_421826 [Fimicolochytrium jonesii]
MICSSQRCGGPSADLHHRRISILYALPSILCHCTPYVSMISLTVLTCAISDGTMLGGMFERDGSYLQNIPYRPLRIDQTMDMVTLIRLSTPDPPILIPAPSSSPNSKHLNIFHSFIPWRSRTDLACQIQPPSAYAAHPPRRYTLRRSLFTISPLRLLSL